MSLKVLLGSVTGVEFAAFLAVFMPSMLAVMYVITRVPVSTEVVFLSGVAFSRATQLVSSWFAERYVNRVRGVEPEVAE